MKYSLSTAALAASATLVLAAPTELVGRSTFHVDLVSSGRKILKNGPAHMLKTYQKYATIGAVAPANVVSAAASAAQQGSVVASPQQYDEAYVCPVTIGGQTLNLDFDTGSADLWTFSTLTPSSQSTGHNLYNPSSGTKKNGETWSITYGDQSGASGVVYADTVVIGGVTATSQAVEAATSVSSSFTQNTGSDGLVGLGFSSINTVSPDKQTTFFDTVKSSLSQPLFAADLRAGSPGSYQFGYIDSSKYKGQLSYVSVDNSQGFWQFTAGGGIGTVIADTGTSLVYLPLQPVFSYYSKVRGASYDFIQGGYTFPCSASLPDFTVQIGSASYTIPGKYIKYAPVSSGSSTCFGGIQLNFGIGMSILGDIFLKSVYAVFDETQSSPRIGFAQK